MSSSVVLVMPEEDRWFFAELGRGASDHAAEHGHRVEIARIPEGPAAAVQAAAAIETAFAGDDCLGAVVAGFQHRGGDTSRVLAWRRPVVIIGGSALGFPVVSFDDVGVGMNTTKHLLGLGHTRIAHLTGLLDPAHSFVYLRGRARGYRIAMESAGLEPETVETLLQPAVLRDTVRGLLQRPEPPTAVFAASDEVAFTVMDIAAELGITIGRDLSVAGVNDHPQADARGLTTSRHKPAEVGATAVDMILDGLAAGPDRSKSRLHPTTFVTRGSTRRLDAA